MDLLNAPPTLARELTMMRTELYPLYREGHLLESGGLADQPARYLAYMRHFDTMARASDEAYAKATGESDDDELPPDV
jgi:hypothetical protein